MDEAARRAWANRYAAVPSSGAAPVSAPVSTPVDAPSAPGESMWGWDGQIADSVWDGVSNGVVRPVKTVLWDYPGAAKRQFGNAVVGVANKIETGSFHGPEQIDPRAGTVRVVTQKLVDDYGMTPQKAATWAESAVDSNGELTPGAVSRLNAQVATAAQDDAALVPAAPGPTVQELYASALSRAAAEQDAKNIELWRIRQESDEEMLGLLEESLLSQFSTPLNYADINNAEAGALGRSAQNFAGAQAGIGKAYSEAIAEASRIADSMSAYSGVSAGNMQGIYNDMASTVAASNDDIAAQYAAAYGIDGGVTGDAVDAIDYANSQGATLAQEIVDSGNVQADLARTLQGQMPSYEADQVAAAGRIRAGIDGRIADKYADARIARSDRRFAEEQAARNMLTQQQFAMAQDARDYKLGLESTPGWKESVLEGYAVDAFKREADALYGDWAGSGASRLQDVTEAVLMLPNPMLRDAKGEEREDLIRDYGAEVSAPISQSAAQGIMAVALESLAAADVEPGNISNIDYAKLRDDIVMAAANSMNTPLDLANRTAFYDWAEERMSQVGISNPLAS